METVLKDAPITLEYYFEMTFEIVTINLKGHIELIHNLLKLWLLSVSLQKKI